METPTSVFTRTLTELPIIPAVIAGSIFLCLAYVIYQLAVDPLKHVPGPFISRFSDILDTYYSLTAQRSIWIHSLHEKYGPTVRVNTVEVDFIDPELIRKMSAMGSSWTKWWEHFRALNTYSGLPNVFTMRTPKDHGIRRKLLAPGYAKGNVARLEPFVVHKARLIVHQYLQSRAQKMNVILWHRFFAADIVNLALFGRDLQMVDTGNIHPFVADIDTIVAGFGIDMTLHWPWHILKKVGPYFLPKHWALRRFLDAPTRAYEEFGIPAVKEYAEKFGYGGENKEILSKLLAAYDAKEGDLTFMSVVSEMTDDSIAGTDTTATTLSFLQWRLATNDVYRKRLHAELDEAIPDVSHLPSFRELEQLPLLSNIIKETLRLETAISSSQPRIVPAGGVVTAEGVFIPGGTPVGATVYTLHRNKAVWGEDANEWKPDRWQNVTKEQMAAFRPFGGGPTICLGIHLAYMELYVHTAMIHRNFEVKMAPGFTSSDMDQRDHSIIFPKAGRVDMVYVPKPGAEHAAVDHPATLA